MGIVFDQSLNTTDDVRFTGISLRDGTSASDISIYNTYTSDSDYERLDVKWDSGVPVIGVAVGSGGGNYPNWIQIQNESSKFLVKHNGFEFQDATTLLQLNPTNIKVFKDFYPNNDGETSFGTSNNRWLHTYSVNGSFSGDLVTEAGGTQYIYNSYTDASNYERLELKWDTNVATIATSAAGTGTYRNLVIGGPSYTTSGNLFFNASNGNVALRHGTTEVLSTGSVFVQVGRNFYPSSDSLRTNGTDIRRWLNTYTDSITIGNGVDAVLTADAADTLALRNGTNAQVLQVYNTYTDASNYERAIFGWDAGILKIGVQDAGTGSGSRPVSFYTDSSFGFKSTNGGTRFSITSSAVSTYLNFQPNADSIRELGRDALRWATTYTDELTVTDNIQYGSGSNNLYIYPEAGSTTAASLRLTTTGWIQHRDVSGDVAFMANNLHFSVNADSPLTFSTSLNSGTVGDTRLYRDAANTLALRNSTNAQQFNVYNTYTDASNYERLEVKWDTNTAEIRPTAAGTGTQRGLTVQTNRLENEVNYSYIRVGVGTSAPIRCWRDVEPQLDSGFDLGNNTLRWATTYTDALVATDTVSAGDGSVTAPAFTFDSQSTMGLYRHAVNQINIVAGANYGANIGTSAFAVSSSMSIGWRNAPNLSQGTSIDTQLHRESTGVIGQYNELFDAPQAYHIYNTWTDVNNYERLEFKWEDNGFGADRSVIETTAGGTGGGRTLALRAANNIIDIRSDVDYMLRIRKNFGITCNENVIPNNSNARSLGTTSLRWKTTYTDGIATNVETFTAASDTLDALNNVALCDCTSNAITINLPAASTATGLQFYITKVDNSANTVTIDPDSSETIDGSATKVLTVQYQSVKVVSDGSNWYSVASQPSASDVEGSGTAGSLAVWTDTDTIGTGLLSESSNILTQKNSTNAQAYHLYNTDDGAGNYERLEIKWDSNDAFIGAAKAGTGSSRTVSIGRDGVASLICSGSGGTRSRSIIPDAASTYSLGIDNLRWSVVKTDAITIGDGTGTYGSVLTDDADNVLALRKDTNAQAFNIYNTYTDASNYERGFMKWDGNLLKIGTEAAGTGTVRTLDINGGIIDFRPKGSLSFRMNFDAGTGHLHPVFNGNLGRNTNDAYRFGTAYLGGRTLTDDAPALDITSTWNDVADTFTLIKADVTDTASAAGSLLMDLQVGGTSKFSVDKDGTVSAGDGSRTAPAFTFESQSTMGIYRAASNQINITPGLSYGANVSPYAFAVSADMSIGWRSGNNLGQGTSFDTQLHRESTGVIGQYNQNTDAPQAYHLYNTWTDASNYERLEIKWDTNVATISATSAGTGSNRWLKMWSGDGDSGVVVKTDSVAFHADQAGTQRMDVLSNSVRFWQPARPQADGFTSLGLTSYRWSNTYTDTITIGDGVDAVLTADAANELALRNGTNAQTQRIYRSYTDASNNEGMEFLSDTFNRINSFANGTGTLGSIEIQVGGSRRFRGDSSFAYIQGQTGGYIFYGAGALKPQSANSIDLGGTSNRWTNTYSVDGDFSGDLTVSGHEGKLVLLGQSSTFNTTGAVCTIYQSDDDGGSYPFTSVGNLILQSRATAARDIVFATGTTPTAKMVVAAAGNVGIGINSPTSRLHVVGDIYNTGTITTDGGFADLLAVSGTSAPEVRINSTDSVIFDGDEFGRLQWYMNDANTNGTGPTSHISAIFNDNAAGGPAQQTAGEGTDLVFSTGLVLVTGQTQTVTEKLRIDKNGVFKHAVGAESHWYNLDTDASNYERLEVKWDTNRAEITTEAAGAGTDRVLRLSGAGTAYIDLDTFIKLGYSARPTAAAGYDFGAPQVEWRGVYARDVNVGTFTQGVAKLTSDADDELALRNSTTAQQFNVYNTYTDASNYERLEVKFDTNIAKISTAAAGTGTQRLLQFECSESQVNSTSANRIMGFAYNGSEKVRFTYTSLEPKVANISLGSNTSGQKWGTTFTKYIALGDGVDAVLTADAADTLAMRNGTNFQTAHFYGTYTDASNYERLSIEQFGTRDYYINTNASGTGAAKGLYLGYFAQRKIGIFADIYTYAEMRPVNDSNYSIGVSSARYANAYFDSITIGDGVDAVLTADAADTLALRNGTTHQTMHIYGTYTDASNYERLVIGEFNSNDDFVITTEGTGTGINRTIYLSYGGKGAGNRNIGIGSGDTRFYKDIRPQYDSSETNGVSAARWSNTYTDSITIGDGTDAILNGDGTGKIYMGNDTSQLTQFAVRGEDDGAGNYNQLEMRMAANGACGLYSTGYGTQTPSPVSVYSNNVKAAEFSSTQIKFNLPFRPTSNGSGSVGTPAIAWSNLYLTATGGVYFNNSQYLKASGGSVIEQANGTTAQAYHLYNTYTDASNYERLEVKWDTNIATIGPDAAGTGTQRKIRLTADSGDSQRTCIDLDASTSALSFRVSSSTAYTLNASKFGPEGLAARTLGNTTDRWANTYTDAITIGDGVDAITADSKQLKVDVDVSRLIADPDGAGISSFVQLTGDSQWANNTYGHSFTTELASNSQGPSNQVTGVHNSLIFRDSAHTGTQYWGMSNSVTTMASINFTGDKVYAAQNRFSNSHYISIGNSTEIAGMNCSQSWTYDPTVTGSPILAGAVFNLTTGALESAGYTHIRVNNAGAPTGGSAGPQFLYGLYIEEQTQAQNPEDNFTILTEGGRSSIKELDTDVFRIYNTFTDFSNYEALEMKWDTNVAVIAPNNDGTGTLRTLRLSGDGGNSVRTAIDIIDSGSKIIFRVSGLSGYQLSNSGFVPVSAVPRYLGSDNTTNRWAGIYLGNQTGTTNATLMPDDAHTLALRNSTNAQAFNVYNTYTDASNYERLEVKFDTNEAVIASTAAGTGTQRDLVLDGPDIRFRINGADRFTINKSTSRVQTGFDLIPSSNNGVSCGIATQRWFSVSTNGLRTAVQTITASSDTLGGNDNVALCDCTSNNITINLPAASGKDGLQYHIKKTDSSSNTVTIDADGTETIDGALTQVISAQYESITIVSDGSNWHII